jgi:phage/plasmid-like protein (TIGR03299 family)
MAHQLSQREDGSFEYAYLESDGKPWHNLGTAMLDGMNLDDWKLAAGMSFKAESAPVQFALPDGRIATVEDKKVIFRGDNMKPMGVVGSGFKIVQPEEVMEFFAELFTLHDMQMSSAGVLFDGKRFFATAKTGNSFKLDGVDEVKGYLLVATAIDGSLATTVKFTSCRTVCSNTLAVALGERGNEIRVTHKSEWNPKQIKIDMGLLDAGWASFKGSIETLASQKVSDDWAKEFIRKMMVDGKRAADDQTTTTLNRIREVEELYTGGMGAEMSYGTKWGVLNAFTEAYTHGFTQGRRKTASSQFASSQFGADEAAKTDVLQALLAA